FPAPPTVIVHVEYSADPLPPAPAGGGNAAPEIAAPPGEPGAVNPKPEDLLYAFETKPLGFAHEDQLVLLDSAGLNAEEYLFIHEVSEPGDPPKPVHWTRIRAVTGPVLDVSPKLTFPLNEFRKQAVRGYSKPARPASLDKDHYAFFKDLSLPDPKSGA